MLSPVVRNTTGKTVSLTNSITLIFCLGQGRRKVLKLGGARYIAATLRANFKVIFVSFSPKK